MRPGPASSKTVKEELDRQLHELFHGVAASRSRAEDEAILDAAIEAAECSRPLDTERRRLEAALGRGFPRAA